MPRILLTSFEPFGGFALNSSLEVGRAVAERPPEGIGVEWIVLPVVAGECVRRVWERVEAERFDCIVALGQATGEANVCLETRGANLDDFSAPDNGGNQPRDQPIVPGGPPYLDTSVPVESLIGRLERAGLSAEPSRDAGSYVCNHLYYSLLHRASATPGSPRVLFVHLPVLPEQSARLTPLPSRPLEEMARAVREILRGCVRQEPEASATEAPSVADASGS